MLRSITLKEKKREKKKGKERTYNGQKMQKERKKKIDKKKGKLKERERESGEKNTKNVTVPGKRDHLGNFFKIELLLPQGIVGFELQNALHI